jgi:chromosome segregation ATPase
VGLLEGALKDLEDDIRQLKQDLTDLRINVGHTTDQLDNLSGTITENQENIVGSFNKVVYKKTLYYQCDTSPQEANYSPEDQNLPLGAKLCKKRPQYLVCLLTIVFHCTQV